ncbi:MAG TPA: zinc ribbon domain-containing protein [Thermoanaerobacterium sp.]|nr:zinc ribbon domain-containing protein [Thermoanaerobacterium sp.]
MPIYDFVCSECDASRPLLVDYEAKEGLELICVHCGGVMRAAPVAMFTVIRSTTVEQPTDQKKVKPCGHTHHCRCAAIKQKAPNPFQKQINEALGAGEHQ